MFSLAASGGGSSHPVHPASAPLFGYGSMTELYKSAIAFLETVDRAKKEDLEARLKSLVHSEGPLNPKIVGKFFQVVCQESVRNPSYEDYDHLREKLEKLFGLIPEIKSSFGSYNDASTILVHVTDIKGESKPLHFPTRMVINSGVMRDFMEKRAAGGAGDTEPAWTFQLPSFCTFESFDDYLYFYQTGTLDESSLKKSCQLLKLADYLIDNKMCVSIVDQLVPKLRKTATLEDLKTIINTLGASIPEKKLIDASLSHLIKEAIDKKQTDRFFAELAGSEVKEVLAGLDISLRLDRKNITDELVKQLTAAFPNMTELGISSTLITDEGLAYLATLTSLTSLDLSRCEKITHVGLNHLKALTSLTKLNLSDCNQITDEGFAFLRALTSLTSLDLAHCGQITDVGLNHLKALTSLTKLNLAGCRQITDAGLALLESLTSLSKLYLIHCYKITDAGLDRLAALPSLTSLNLSGCRQITGEGFAHLRALTSLTKLDLSDCPITDTGLDCLAALTSLASLDLSYCYKITDVGLTYLQAFTSLTSLRLSGCSQITGEGFAHLRALTSLTELDLSYCNQITGADLAFLEALPSISELNLAGCYGITNSSLDRLKSLVCLTLLALSSCRQITDTGLGHLTTLTSLRFLDLSGCLEITDRGLALLETLPFLKNLNLVGCPSISATGRARLAEKGVEILFL